MVWLERARMQRSNSAVRIGSSSTSQLFGAACLFHSGSFPRMRNLQLLLPGLLQPRTRNTRNTVQHVFIRQGAGFWEFCGLRLSVLGGNLQLPSAGASGDSLSPSLRIRDGASLGTGGPETLDAAEEMAEVIEGFVEVLLGGGGMPEGQLLLTHKVAAS